MNIESSTKDFYGRAKSYTTPMSAMNELLVNAFFVPNVKDFGVGHMYGLVAGYDNGYTPLYAGGMGLLGNSGKFHYNRTRARIIAHPGDGTGLVATVKDWQKFFEEYGGLDAAKIQKGGVCAKIARKENNGSGIVAQKGWENFKSRIIDPMMKKFNDWKEDDSDVTDDDILGLNNLINQSFDEAGDHVEFKLGRMTNGKFVDFDYNSEGMTVIFNATHPAWSGLIGPKLGFELKVRIDCYVNAFHASCQKLGKESVNNAISSFCKKFNNFLREE